MMFCKRIYPVQARLTLALGWRRVYVGHKSEASTDQNKGNNEQIIFNQLMEQHLNEEQA